MGMLLRIFHWVSALCPIEKNSLAKVHLDKLIFTLMVSSLAFVGLLLSLSTLKVTDVKAAPHFRPSYMPTCPTSKTILFVVGNLTLSAGDTAVKAHLEANGYTVIPIDDDVVTNSDAEEKVLVLISGSAFGPHLVAHSSPTAQRQLWLMNTISLIIWAW